MVKSLVGVNVKEKMKVYLSNYRSHWISPYTIMEKIIFWREIDYDEPIVKTWSLVLTPLCYAWQKFLDSIHPKIEIIKIDRWDTWSMDHTLAHIILPMLIQLRNDKHGSPMVDDEDVPENLKSVKTKKPRKAIKDLGLAIHAIDYSGDESTIHLKWNWVLDEMIWAFEQKVKDDDESQFFDHTVSKGNPWDKDYVSPNVDWDGLKAHQARKTNGYRLFGKYYEGLWD